VSLPTIKLEHVELCAAAKLSGIFDIKSLAQIAVVDRQTIRHWLNRGHEILHGGKYSWESFRRRNSEGQLMPGVQIAVWEADDDKERKPIPDPLHLCALLYLSLEEREGQHVQALYRTVNDHAKGYDVDFGDGQSVHVAGDAKTAMALLRVARPREFSTRTVVLSDTDDIDGTGGAIGSGKGALSDPSLAPLAEIGMKAVDIA